jgi:hypothetical protein
MAIWKDKLRTLKDAKRSNKNSADTLGSNDCGGSMRRGIITRNHFAA